MKESIEVKLAGEIIGKNGDVLALKTIGTDNKGREHEDLHMVLVASGSADMKVGQFVACEGTIVAGEKNQVVSTERVQPSEQGKYKNLAKIIGVVTDQPLYFPRTLEGKQQMMNIQVTANGTKILGTLFGSLAQDFKVACPITSEVQLYGRMRRKELVDREGDTRKWIDIVSDNWHFPGLTKVTKKGTGGIDEFAKSGGSVSDALAFIPKKADPKPAAKADKARKIA
jgi:hypothetical protein